MELAVWVIPVAVSVGLLAVVVTGLLAWYSLGKGTSLFNEVRRG